MIDILMAAIGWLAMSTMMVLYIGVCFMVFIYFWKQIPPNVKLAIRNYVDEVTKTND